jgi:hypothetical protein
MASRGAWLVAAWSALSCASATPCGLHRVCGLPSLAPSGGATGESRVALAWADRAASGEGDLSGRDALVVGRGGLFLGFQVPEAALQGRLERALLVLVPHPGAGTGAGVVRVRAVRSPWTAGSVAAGRAPVLDEAVLAQARLPADGRAVLRLEVTEALLAWRAGTGPTGDLYLEADGDGVHFVGPGALGPLERPRLEVQFR